MDPELIADAMAWLRDHYGDDAFVRGVPASADRGDEADRPVYPLDDRAQATIRVVIRNLIVVARPALLDLLAGASSHLPDSLAPRRMVGLGVEASDLEANGALSERVVQDLDENPVLPFPENSFDGVLLTNAVDQLGRPLEVFSEVHRVLEPGGLLLVIFSDRLEASHSVRIWARSSEQERLALLERYFEAAGFGTPKSFSSVGRPRPAHDERAHLGIPSDPIHAVYACKAGGTATTPSAAAEDGYPDAETLRRRKAETRETLCCPYCGERMKRLRVPDTPFTEWDVAFFRICFNDACPFLERGWRAMNEQGNYGFATRAMYISERHAFGSVPIRTLSDLRDGIVEDE